MRRHKPTGRKAAGVLRQDFGPFDRPLLRRAGYPRRRPVGGARVRRRWSCDSHPSQAVEKDLLHGRQAGGVEDDHVDLFLTAIEKPDSDPAGSVQRSPAAESE